MINYLEVNRFKSIKSLAIDCRKINLFIGEPNTGKSNILEVLGLLSYSYHWPYRNDFDLKSFCRFERFSNLFHDELVDLPVTIRWHDHLLQSHSFSLAYGLGSQPFLAKCDDQQTVFLADHDKAYPESQAQAGSAFRFYRFHVREGFPGNESDFLVPPSGDNLLSLLMHNRDLRATVNDLFGNQGLRIGLRPQESKIEVIKSFDDIIISYPYSLASETLQRLAFYQAAIMCNRDSVLVFEEPESHSFPYHTKYLAEQIALSENGNQYFIATHNPYFLLPVLEKTKIEDVAVHIVYYADYQTKTQELASQDLSELAEIDVFANLYRYLSVP